MSGGSGYDVEKLWEAVVKNSNTAGPLKSVGRFGVEYYNKLGYVPYNVGVNENCARTLEYAYDDWAIYKIGKKLGKTQTELEPFAKRAMNYKNVFDSTHNLMRGRNLDGTFQSPFNPYKWGDAFTEGNSWHYTWSVFHDIDGLKTLMGGNQSFAAMLDSVFVVPPIFDNSYYGFTIHEIREMQIMNMGNYAHGNQPIQHMAYLYNYCGQPWKTQARVREIMNKMYTPAPDGYCGDEDNGQTSAWYVFSAMGFYPVCPGSGQYVLGAPLFNKITIALENGKKVIINAPENTAENFYIKQLRLNGKVSENNWLDFQQLKKGSQIEIEMTKVPNIQRGIKKENEPYSFSREAK